MEIITEQFQLPRKDLAFFQFLLEGYDGISAIETLDPRSGVVQIHILPGFLPEAAAVLAALLAELGGKRFTA
jgi:hypothetical protein